MFSLNVPFLGPQESTIFVKKSSKNCDIGEILLTLVVDAGIPVISARIEAPSLANRARGR